MNDKNTKIGRLLMIGFEGTELSKDMVSLLRDYGIGGFVLFERNLKTPEQILMLNKQLLRVDEGFVPVLAVDHEGGRVQRLKHPFTHLPSARKIGELYQRHKSIDFIYEYGTFIAKELSAAGFNMALAPVLDLPEKEGGVIGDRAFSDVPLIVEEIGVSMIAGMQDNGIIACAKHFPGHTDTKTDPHKGQAVADITPDALMKHMTPFIHAIKNRVGSIMVSHTVFKGMESVPASLSHRVINFLLKKEMGFKGMVITDDIQMAAVSQNFSVSGAVIGSLKAGADMVMVGNITPEGLKRVFDDVEVALTEGDLSRDLIEDSFVRADIIKGEIGARENILYSAQEMAHILGDERHRAFVKKL